MCSWILLQHSAFDYAAANREAHPSRVLSWITPVSLSHEDQQLISSCSSRQCCGQHERLLGWLMRVLRACKAD